MCKRPEVDASARRLDVIDLYHIIRPQMPEEPPEALSEVDSSPSRSGNEMGVCLRMLIAEKQPAGPDADSAGTGADLPPDADARMWKDNLVTVAEMLLKLN